MVDVLKKEYIILKVYITKQFDTCYSSRMSKKYLNVIAKQTLFEESKKNNDINHIMLHLKNELFNRIIRIIYISMS